MVKRAKKKKGSLHQVDLTVVNIYLHITAAPKELIKLKEEIIAIKYLPLYQK